MKPKIQNFHDYRLFLKSFLSSRREENREFSLRAWARNVGVPPSTFSEVLNGRRHLPMDIAARVSRSLGVSHEERMQFLLLVIATHALDAELLQYLKQLTEVVSAQEKGGELKNALKSDSLNLEPV
ncbi:MAG: hypothetical protein K2X47_14855 [Bdellovibrionales bacterium]|nr:hypothetical protein [Bdellovibrionales bacterium]